MLAGLSAAGWVVFLGQTQRPIGMDGEMSMQPGVGPDLTMGGSWLLYLVMWAAMMGAMMVPAATPMVLMYARVRGDAKASVVLFTGAYLGLWVGFGGLASSTLVVFPEKVAPQGRSVALVASSALIICGVAVVLQPSLLPTVA